jgi:hypothetical protein
MQLKADTEAVTWLRRALEANRNFPIAHFALAAALALLGEIDQARAAVQTGLGRCRKMALVAFGRQDFRPLSLKLQSEFRNHVQRSVAKLLGRRECV